MRREREKADKKKKKRPRLRTLQITAELIFSQGRRGREREKERERERGPLQLGDAGNRSKSGQINDLAERVQTDLNHNSWCRGGRTSVLCSVLTAVQQEPRDGALGCTYTGRQKKKIKGI